MTEQTSSDVPANMTKEERRAFHQQRLAAQQGSKPSKKKEKTVLTKAERRAQHAQRTAAAAEKKSGGGEKTETASKSESKSEIQASTSASTTTTSTPAQTKSTAKSVQPPTHEPSSPRSAATTLFVPHLPLPPKLSDVIDTGPILRPRNMHTDSSSTLHPAVVRLGYHYVTGTVRGGNARCRAMLHVLRTAVVPSAVTATDLTQAFAASFQFWTACRPHSVSMGNAFSFIKAAMATLDRDMAVEAVRANVTDLLQTYERERIEYAVKAIGDTAHQKLQQHPRTIVTYGYSEAVMAVLWQLDGDTTVVVVDSPPLYEGRRTRRLLQAAGMACRYIHLSALTYVLASTSDTQVLLGAAALHTDGSVTGRVGTAVVALCAHQIGRPVLVCAETYKIAARQGSVPLESLTYNELYNDNDTAKKDETTNAGCEQLSLLYDLTPASWISGIITELGLVPPTSVAVLLREMNPHELKQT